MRIAILAVSAIVLAGCAPQQELWNRPGGWTQVQLDHDYQECTNLSALTPKVWHDTDVYTNDATTIGNTTTVTTRPDPYAQLGQTIADSQANDDRKIAMRRYCMNTKGYNFVGVRDIPAH